MVGDYANWPTIGSTPQAGAGRIFQSPAGGPRRSRVGGWATVGVAAGGNPASNYDFRLRLTCCLGCKDANIVLLSWISLTLFVLGVTDFAFAPWMIHTEKSS
jgi:hypothetical protein